MKLTVREQLEKYSVPDPNSGCWLWIRYQNKDGYGKLNVGNKVRFSHRVSYEIYKGSIPKGMNVCHKCDTPACINPDHLWLGTQRENIIDMFKKGRAIRKINSGCFKQKTNCHKGHELSGNNLRVYGGQRVCWICNIERQKKYRELNKEKIILYKRKWRKKHGLKGSV